MKRLLKKIIPLSLVNYTRQLLSRVKSKWSYLKRLLVTPPLPQNTDGRVLIHLGGGIKNDPSWINVDLLPLPHIHYLQDVTDLSNFRNNYADLIYSSHVLEHISHRKLITVLKGWHRVLKTDGILRLAVPDFDKIIEIYVNENKNMKTIMEPLMGGQDYQYNFHYSMFNKDYLSNLLKEAGFKDIRVWDPDTVADHPFSDWSNKPITILANRYPISLNIESIK